MTQGVDYDLYCATAAGTLATRVDFYSSGFTAQPTQFSLGAGTSFVIRLTTVKTIVFIVSLGNNLLLLLRCVPFVLRGCIRIKLIQHLLDVLNVQLDDTY